MTFRSSGSPAKRASEHLRMLEDEKLIEGKSRAIGLPKVWRLTKRGRDRMGVTARPVSFTSGKIEHWLSIMDDFMVLTKIGAVTKWAVEPRYPFKSGGKSYIYSPDAYFWIKIDGKNRAYFLEHQDSPLTSKRWAEKWGIFRKFNESPDFNTAAFQILKDKPFHPRVIVISTQQLDTIKSGAESMEMIIAKDVKSLKL